MCLGLKVLYIWQRENIFAYIPLANYMLHSSETESVGQEEGNAAEMIKEFWMMEMIVFLA